MKLSNDTQNTEAIYVVATLSVERCIKRCDEIQALTSVALTIAADWRRLYDRRSAAESSKTASISPRKVIARTPTLRSGGLWARRWDIVKNVPRDLIVKVTRCKWSSWRHVTSEIYEIFYLLTCYRVWNALKFLIRIIFSNLSQGVSSYNVRKLWNFVSSIYDNTRLIHVIEYLVNWWFLC